MYVLARHLVRSGACSARARKTENLCLSASVRVERKSSSSIFPSSRNWGRCARRAWRFGDVFAGDGSGEVPMTVREDILELLRREVGGDVGSGHVFIGVEGDAASCCEG